MITAKEARQQYNETLSGSVNDILLKIDKKIHEACKTKTRILIEANLNGVEIIDVENDKLTDIGKSVIDKLVSIGYTWQIIPDYDKVCCMIYW